MEGHLHQQQFRSNQQQHNIPGIFSQVNYMSGGMCTSLAQPSEGKNINTNGGEKFFRTMECCKAKLFPNES
ncbi:hypothetical protein RDI58_026778 [Solanum bulbocastanum]|uniref:Uncharacterized protein n=1 Tax=Solanum bulbocastanum TaxID=147425 RepID=A0AAN8SX07_SOLBU